MVRYQPQVHLQVDLGQEVHLLSCKIEKVQWEITEFELT